MPGYHAIEVRTYQPDGERFAATITDSFGGVRELYSPGLTVKTLTWTNAGAPADRFAYPCSAMACRSTGRTPIARARGRWVTR